MKITPVGRLILRVEGGWWVASYAMSNTTEGAVEIARIRLGVMQDEGRRRAFMDLCKSVIADFLKAKTGADPEWSDEQAAPEHERSGRA
jgi:hypothetical protein